MTTIVLAAKRIPWYAYVIMAVLALAVAFFFGLALHEAGLISGPINDGYEWLHEHSPINLETVATRKWAGAHYVAGWRWG
jgi:hypothetical protein